MNRLIVIWRAGEDHAILTGTASAPFAMRYVPDSGHTFELITDTDLLGAGPSSLRSIVVTTGPVAESEAPDLTLLPEQPIPHNATIRIEEVSNRTTVNLELPPQIIANYPAPIELDLVLVTTETRGRAEFHPDETVSAEIT